MTDETPSTVQRTDSTPDGVAGLPAVEYHEWSDECLIDCYRRNSVLLREYGADERTIRTLCAVEEHLRARDIDPDRIVGEVKG